MIKNEMLLNCLYIMLMITNFKRNFVANYNLIINWNLDFSLKMLQNPNATTEQILNYKVFHKISFLPTKCSKQSVQSILFNNFFWILTLGLIHLCSFKRKLQMYHTICILCFEPATCADDQQYYVLIVILNNLLQLHLKNKMTLIILFKNTFSTYILF